MRIPLIALLALLGACSSTADSPPSGDVSSGAEDEDLGPITGEVTGRPEAWAELPLPEPSPIELRLELLLPGATSQLARRSPLHDDTMHEISYTGRLACVAEREGDTLTVDIGPPGGQQWDLARIRVTGPAEALEAEASAAWYRDFAPSHGAWEELEGSILLSDQYPTVTGPIRGDFELRGSVAGHANVLVGRFVLDEEGRCHARTDGSFRARTLERPYEPR